jgi:hypothetical protein
VKYVWLFALVMYGVWFCTLPLPWFVKVNGVVLATFLMHDVIDRVIRDVRKDRDHFFYGTKK